MGKIIAITNQKGGVGKTTTAINITAALAHNQKKVLLIDLDQQANATIGVGLSRELIDLTSYDLLATDIDAAEVIYNNLGKNFSIIPASTKLSSIYQPMAHNINRQFVLRNKLQTVKDEYDYIILDCPPSLGLIVDNAMIASDSVIIPAECEFFAYDALTQMINQINKIQKIKTQFGEKLTIEGVLLTKLDNRALYGYKMMDKVKEMFPSKTFKTVINRSIHIEEAPLYGQSVLQYAYNSKGSKDYRELVKEILRNNGEDI
ncbi:MAG: ParA family protein [Bacilli bacterium]